MKKHSVVLLFVISLIFSNFSFAQVTKTVGASGADYSCLKLAFDDINSGILTGSIVLKIIDNTSESTTAALNGSGGSANYTSVNIYPTVSGLTISGDLSYAVLQLSGANNVIIDGRVNGTDSSGGNLTIVNYNTVGPPSFATTISFTNDASYNTLKYCTVRGKYSACGVIIFNASSGSNGNCNNIIDRNNITNIDDSHRPHLGVYSLGASWSNNSNNTISNNNFYDICMTTSGGTNILIGQYSSNWTITGNSIYETTAITSASDVTIEGIVISGTGSHTVSGNFIGGSSARCGGSPWTRTGSGIWKFTGISVQTDSANTCSIQGNTIKNISISGLDKFKGIYAVSGTVNIGNVTPNTIGASTGNSSITLGGKWIPVTFFGIYLGPNVTGNVNVTNNIIGAVTAPVDTIACSFWGICDSSSGSSTTISNNIIGSTDAGTTGSINMATTGRSSAQTVFGIFSGKSGRTTTVTISGNTISKLTNGTTNSSTSLMGQIYGIRATNGSIAVQNNTVRDLTIANAYNNSAAGSTDSVSVCGIGYSNGSEAYSQTISGNTIYNLSNTYASFAGRVIGLYFYGTSGQTNVVTRNFIYGLTVTGASSTTAGIEGMTLKNTSETSNNIVSLGGNTSTAITGVRCILSNNVYFNTVYIGGSLGSGITNKSYAFSSVGSITSLSVRNNIFANARSTTSGTNLHYGAYVPTAPSSYTFDNNDYYVSGTGGMLGYWGGSNISSLPLNTGTDASSSTLNPLLSNAGGTSAADYRPSSPYLFAATGTGVTVDYTGASRSGTNPSMGAYEITLSGKINITATSGTATGSYMTLKGAFDAINSGTHQGTITITVNLSTTELSSAVLYQSGYGSASSYSSVTIYPADTGLSISGSLAAPLIDLNGAANVTIDGRVNASGTGKSLVISNTSASSTANTCTIRFINDASSNTIKYCSIKGSSTSSADGIFSFSTTTGTMGNDGNTIDNNNITCSSDAGRPLNAVYSLGTSAKENSGNTISNNYIYNFLNRSTSSYGIDLKSYTTAWTISGNSFYETASFVPTSSVSYYAIYINNSSGTNFTVSGNYIGGSSASCGGTAWTKTNAYDNTFGAIYVSAGTGTASNIQGNTIMNFSYSNSGASPWYGIYASSGDLNIGTVSGNTIGAATGNGSITLTQSSSGGYFEGIYITSSGTVSCKNNILGAITAANTNGAYSTGIYGIFKSSSAGTLTINDNTIGSTSTSNSLYTGSASTSNIQNIYGIYSLGTGTVTISGNTIANVTNGTTNATPSTAGLITGIYSGGGANTISNNTIRNLTISSANNANSVSSSITGIVVNNTASSIQIINGNTIFNLNNNYPSFAGYINGIYYAGPTTLSFVLRNYVYGLSAAANTTSTLCGIRIASGTTYYFSNIIFLGDNNPASVIGIYEYGSSTSNNSSIYFNTVYIAGTVSSGSLSSYALYSSATTNTRNFRGNIFFNARSNNGASGSHYAAYFNYATTSNLTLELNDYYTSGTGGYLGYYNSANVNSLPLIATLDMNSKNANPSFANPGGTSAADYKPSNNTLNGPTGVPNATVDYTNASRVYYSMGAYDYAVTSGIINVTSTSGTPSAGYSYLKDAFDAINAGVHKGTITIMINSSTNENNAAILYNSGYTSSSYTSVKIYPTTTGLSINSSKAGSLIVFDGADNVTIDGRVNATGTTRDLVISNSSTSSSASTSTIRFVDDATSDTVRYCTIKGSTTSSSDGVIDFGTTTGTTGNDNNTIYNNSITNASDANRPINAVYSGGTSAKENSGITISGNDIFDFLNRGSASYGINLNSNTTACTVTGNNFYETTTFVPSANVSYNIIYSTNSGSNFVINNNSIGGTSVSCGGSAWTKTGAYDNPFNAIYLNCSTGTACNIQGNTINNFNYTNSSAGSWTGINIASGDVNIGTTSGNTIGSVSSEVFQKNRQDKTGTVNTVKKQTGKDISSNKSSVRVTNDNPLTSYSITYTAGATGANFYGIYISSTGTVNCKSTVIASITAANSNSAYATNFYGIYKASVSGNTTVTSNTIGSSTVSSSIYVSSASTSNTQSVYGIYNSGSGQMQVTGNTIGNLINTTSNSNTATPGVINGIFSNSGSMIITDNIVSYLTIANANNNALNTASVAGITSTGNSALSGNVVKNLSNTFPSFTGCVIGVYNGTTCTASRTEIKSLSVESSSGASIYGIKINGGSSTYSNSVIILGDNTPVTFYGIYETGASGTNSLYFNTVYISGAPSDGTLNSYALYSAVTTNTRNFRNNIFVNARSNNGASGTNYAAYFAYAVSTNLTLNFNDYYVTGTGGVLGYYNSSNVTSIPLIATMDANSKNADPGFSNPGGNLSTDYIASNSSLGGISGTGITIDFLNNARQYNSMGAFDHAVSLLICVNATSGVTMSNYSTFKEAIDAINAGTHKGDITIKLYISSTESASVVFNASGSGSASYSSIYIYPALSGLTLSCNINGPLLDLNGADNVTIDGRVNASGTAQDLVIQNLNTSGTSASTVRMYNGADNNILEYSVIKGSVTSNTRGVIMIGPTGSSNSNQIIYNKITNAQGNKPCNSIYLYTVTVFNNANVIQNNEIFDNFQSPASYGINVNANSTNTVISSNSIYITSTVTATYTGQENLFYGIYVGSTTAVGTSITANYIGGSQPYAQGNAMYFDNGGVVSTIGLFFHGIHIAGGTNASMTSVQGNIIKNIKVRSQGTYWTQNSYPAVSDEYMFCGIYTSAGADIGTVTPNVIGDPQQTGSIIVTNVYDNMRWSGGIVIKGAVDANVNVKNNILAGITINAISSSSYTRNFIGIAEITRTPSGFTSQHVIENNTIGSESIANSIQIESNTSTSSTGNSLIGILVSNRFNCTARNNIISNLWNNTATNTYANYVNGIQTIVDYINTTSQGTVQITGNTIKNLYLPLQNAYNSTTSISGIVINGTNTSVVSGNTIFNLKNMSTASNTQTLITGIEKNCSTTTTLSVFGNLIYNLTFEDYGTAGAIRGISHNSGTASYYNNIINLGGNTKTYLYGIYDVGSSGNNANVYFNTVYIGGNPASGSTNGSYCLYSLASASTRDYRDNIFCNTRSTTGGSNLHYAAYYGYSSSTGLTMNYNDYYVSGTGGTLAYAGANKTSLPFITGLDANSSVSNPLFTNAGGTTPESYYPGGSLTGTSISGITTDFKGDTRSGTPRMGALEGYVWKGSVSSDYNNSANWLSGSIPGTNSTVVFDASPLNHCILDGDKTLSSIVNSQSAYYLDLNGYTLTLKNNIELNNGARIKADGSGSALIFSGNVPQAISSGTVFENGAVNNVTLNNACGITINAGFTVNNQLALTSGILTLGGSANLTIGQNASIAGTPSSSNMITFSGTGELRKVFTGTGSYTYPVGDNTGTAEYSPVNLNFTSGTFSSAYAGIKAFNIKHVNNASTTDYINRYWTVSQNGISGFSCNVTLQYLPADVVGTEANIWTGKYSGGVWTLLNQTDAVNHRLTGTVTGFSDFTGGQQGILPVSLSSFTSSVIGRDVTLQWITGTEINNAGFDIERKDEKGGWLKIGFINGKGNSYSATTYTFEDRKLPAEKYSYRLKQIDYNGNYKYYELNNIVEVGIPSKYELSQNYPNPFNPSTRIDFQLPVDTKVTIAVYDVTGREIKRLLNNEFKKADYYTVEFNAANFASGVYFYRIVTDKFTNTRKMVLIK